jgi:hypothetical protein
MCFREKTKFSLNNLLLNKIVTIVLWVKSFSGNLVFFFGSIEKNQTF